MILSNITPSVPAVMPFSSLTYLSHSGSYNSLPLTKLNKNQYLFQNNSILRPELLHDKSLNEINNTIPSSKITNSTYDSSQSIDLELEKRIAIIVPILFSLIFIIGLFGNALVVVVVVFNPSMRSTTNLLILNLAIADLLFIVFCVPFTATDYALAHWPFGSILCKIVQYLILVLACASNYTLVLMSLDRYLAVVHPINSMSIRNAKNAYKAICFTWIFILAACSPVLQTHGVILYPEPPQITTYISCTFNSSNYITYSQFQLSFFVSSYLLPLLTAFSLYFLMLKKIWRESGSTTNSRLNDIRCRKRVTRMVVVVVLIFAFCWAPIQFILVLKSLDLYTVDKPIDIVIQVTAQILAYMNSCINPILYAFLSENFRKAFHKVIACNLAGIYGGQTTSLTQPTCQTSCAPTNTIITFNLINSPKIQTNNSNNLRKKSACQIDLNKTKETSFIINNKKNTKNVNFNDTVQDNLKNEKSIEEDNQTKLNSKKRFKTKCFEETEEEIDQIKIHSLPVVFSFIDSYTENIKLNDKVFLDDKETLKKDVKTEKSNFSEISQKNLIQDNSKKVFL